MKHLVKASLCAAVVVAASAGESGAVTFQSMDQYNANLAAPIWTGVGRMVYDTPDQGHICTATLVSRNVVLTAAHCLGQTFNFTLPATGKAGASQATRLFTTSNAVALPNYLNNGKMSDVALFTLDTNVYGREIYELYTDKDELGQVITTVGGGLAGLLSDGFSFELSDFQLRYGKNRYDAMGAVVGYGDDYILMDNDSGLAENDVFGRFFGTNDTGVVEDGKLVEVGVIYGDSGGPDFIGRKISGVHSFGGSGSFIQDGSGNVCGVPGAVDSVVARNGTCSDGSWGDISGSQRVSFYQTQIRDYIAAAAVPEPATWAMMVAGFGLVGGAMRRRRRVAAFA